MHPIAFTLGSLTIRWYGVMVALGFLAGFWTAGRRARLVGIPGEKVQDAGIWLILGTLIGARALYVATYWKDEFARQPFSEIFMVQHGGLVYYGGFIGAVTAGIVYTRVTRIPLWSFADVLAPSIALGYAFGRIGCLLNGCCYGKVCSLPWAIHYPHGSDPFRTQVERQLLDPAASESLPVHPTQVYDSLLSLAFYAGLAWLFRRKKFDGQVFAAYLIGYAVLRSIVESFRGDYPPDHIHGWATPAQLVSMGILAAGVALWAWQYFNARKKPAGELKGK